MDILWICSVLVAVVIGAVVGRFLAQASARAEHGAQSAALRAERDLLAGQVERERARGAEDDAVANELAPLRATLDRVAQHVTTLERDRVEQYGELGTTLRTVAARTQTLGEQTAALSGALNSSGIRGAWGEAQLKRVLQYAGMLARCDFDEQVTAKTTHEATARPDVIVHLPGDKTMVIDAKAPMDAFLRAQADVTPAERDDLLSGHGAALRRHVDALAAKEYWTAFASSPEFVVCFVPSDAVLAAALTSRPELYDHAQSRKVVLASPATLLAVLRATAFAWQQESVSSNAQEVLRLGTELHTRLGTLGKEVTSMGTSLRKSVEAYNKFVGTLEGRVMVTSRKMTELNVVQESVPEISPVETTPRPLTHADLVATDLHDAAAADRRSCG